MQQLDTTTPHISGSATDVPVRGAIPLPSGETAIVLDGGSVLVCKSPRLLSAASSQRVIEEATRRFTPARCAPDAVSNIDGPSRERIMATRRQETQRARDRRTITIGSDEDVPTFCNDVIGSRTDIERQARTEAMRREVPDV